MANQFDQKNEFPEEMRQKLMEATEKDWNELMEAMMNLAKGVYVQDIKTDDAGSPIDVKVYRQKPDKDVAKYLMDQVIGKPKESMNVEGKINLIVDDQLNE